MGKLKDYWEESDLPRHLKIILWQVIRDNHTQTDREQAVARLELSEADKQRVRTSRDTFKILEQELLKMPIDVVNSLSEDLQPWVNRLRADKVSVNYEPRIDQDIMLKGCWHVADKDRLMSNLLWTDKWGVCDLHPLGYRAERWFYDRMRLSIGDRVRFCCKGLIVAEGTIASCPRERTVEDPPIWSSGFPSVVTVENVAKCVIPKQCECYARTHQFGSHRLGGRGPCS